ncbi:MAG: isoprenylcysteine carboxylmethyltransferase family protein [Firmicutes bacterium]|nr:isoprenylcysteine carboxylmethyltransferase family protein [Bacillota bacterium]
MAVAVSGRCRKGDNINRKAVNYTVRVFVQRLLGLLCFLLAARWSMTWQNWVYFGSGFVLTAISTIIIYRIDPETLAQRGKIATDSPQWDKILLFLFWLLNFFVIFVVAGLESGGGVTDNILFWTGMFLSILSAVMATAALAVNTYLESTARIQTERKQTVVSRGVYGIVRHPAYSAVLLSCIGISLVFATPHVCMTAAIIAAIIVIRTFLEDRMLEANLDGYAKYAEKVRYRLVPFIW